MKIHEIYINRCIQLAKNGLGNTYPNPMVGSVIVWKNQIIGEGWHQKAGEAHAEVNAINSVKNKELLKNATIFVSLEPCSHFGKTPPCSDLIIASGIKKVVIGMVDPFPQVSGRGIKKLMDAGCNVFVGVLEKECATLNRRFLTFQLQKRPYIILKWAQTENGFIAPVHQNDERNPVWISNRYSLQRVHKWRSEEQTILMGTKTAVADNPKLNTRHWHGKNPVRVVIDRNLRIQKSSHLFDGSVKTIVVCGGLRQAQPDKEKVNIEKGDAEGKSEEFISKNLYFETIDFNKEIAGQICDILYKHNLQSAIIEGGSQTLQTFIDSGLWDEARVFTGNMQFKKGIKAPHFSGTLVSEEKIDSDILKIYRND